VIDEMTVKRQVKYTTLLLTVLRGIFVVLQTEFIFDTFLYKLPLYYEIKAAFILYLTMPSTQGK
jgi:hypothetical protein